MVTATVKPDNRQIAVSRTALASLVGAARELVSGGKDALAGRQTLFAVKTGLWVLLLVEAAVTEAELALASEGQDCEVRSVPVYLLAVVGAKMLGAYQKMGRQEEHDRLVEAVESAERALKGEG